MEFPSQSQTRPRLFSSIIPRYHKHITYSSPSQHFQKIRREAKNGTTTGGDPTTPTKPKAAKGTPASKRGHGKAFNNGNGADGDDDEPAETPVKRKRGPKKEEFKEDNGGFEGQTAAQFKVEEVGDVVIVDVDDDE
jgi:hypothetical protein